MALTGEIGMDHDQVFPHGCYMVGTVEPKRDFDKSSRDTFVQENDRDTGVPVWVVSAVDCDPDARETAVRVEIVAPVQPVPPEQAPGVPFRPVEFEGLTARPSVRQTSANSKGKLVWYFRATGLHAPAKGAKVPAGNGKAEG